MLSGNLIKMQTYNTGKYGTPDRITERQTELLKERTL